ncbi:hypothetical protein M407DRAFT_30266 [Tulasnella calospora MUT 4182]|uniref:Uncharacterized protein n=1 Tax=Tulasnella calospora MUT 4182 TaxID=1051891 RepID=A0A0C3Q8I6_9AGAM|nr:hypothetical protein M407DRAFT_30266 [Tulasnella calospora MUT 4182]
MGLEVGVVRLLVAVLDTDQARTQLQWKGNIFTFKLSGHCLLVGRNIPHERMDDTGTGPIALRRIIATGVSRGKWLLPYTPGWVVAYDNAEDPRGGVKLARQDTRALAYSRLFAWPDVRSSFGDVLLSYTPSGCCIQHCGGRKPAEVLNPLSEYGGPMSAESSHTSNHLNQTLTILRIVSLGWKEFAAVAWHSGSSRYALPDEPRLRTVIPSSHAMARQKRPCG